MWNVCPQMETGYGLMCVQNEALAWEIPPLKKVGEEVNTL